MDNRYFDRKTTALLCRPEEWKLVSSWCPADIRPVHAAGHQRWMSTHSHAHEHQELLFVLGGDGLQGFQGRIFPCSPGTVFLFDTLEEHDMSYRPSPVRAEHLWLSRIENSFIARMMSVRGDAAIPPARWSIPLSPDEPSIRAAAGFLERRETALFPPETARLRLLTAVSILAATLLKKGYDPEPESPRCSIQKQLLSTIEAHIRKTAGRDTDLDRLARMAGYSKYHFLRLFKQYTGHTVHRYIDLCRLERAREMRRNGAGNKQVSDALGFSCAAAYARWLKRRQEREQLPEGINK